MPRPRQPGLTENELEVMHILWKQSPLSVADILNCIKRTPKPAYTSLLTIIQVMSKKGYICHEKVGKAYQYTPVLKKDKFILSEVKRVAKRLFIGSPGKLVLNMVENEQLTAEEINELKQMLEEIE